MKLIASGNRFIGCGVAFSLSSETEAHLHNNEMINTKIGVLENNHPAQTLFFSQDLDTREKLINVTKSADKSTAIEKFREILNVTKMTTSVISELSELFDWLKSNF